MRTRMMKLARVVFWIAIFSAIGFALMKLAFALVCWIGGHDIFESMLGALASIVLAPIIGIEFFLRFRDWQSGRRGLRPSP